MDKRRDEEPKEKSLSQDSEALEKEAERNREEMDEIPPPGTDPLHEGP